MHTVSHCKLGSEAYAALMELGERERQELFRNRMRNAGFRALAQEKNAELLAARTCYPVWSGGELEAWRKVLDKREQLEDYSGIDPTADVLEAIEMANQISCFKSYEVWSNANRSMLVGIIKIGEVTYYSPVVEWGENLRSLRQELARKFWWKLLVWFVVLLVIAGLTVGFVLTGSWWFVGGPPLALLVSASYV